MNIDSGLYNVTITSPNIIYSNDPTRNITCTYIATNATTNNLKIIHKYTVTNENIDEIFKGTDNTLSDYIHEGDILDFQGTIDKNHYLVINKPINIISTTKNAVINLHTINNNLINNIPINSFVITAEASGSNISDLHIINTQTWIYNVNSLHLENNIFKTVTIYANHNIVFEDNVVEDLIINGPLNINHNNLTSITLNPNSIYSNITNNNITGNITVNANNVTIKSNKINTTSAYAVYVEANGVVVTNNVLYAARKFGDNAISRRDNTVIEDNGPEPSFALLNKIISENSNITLGQDYQYISNIDSNIGIVIKKNLTINGDGYTIDGYNASRIFKIENGAHVTIKDLNIINGQGLDESGHDIGGGIYLIDSTLTIINSNFTHNCANDFGGAIYASSQSIVNIINSTFSDNSAKVAGNIIYVYGGKIVRILGSNVEIGDIANEKGDNNKLASIQILTTVKLILNNIDDYVQGSNTELTIIEPNNFNGWANLTTNTGQTINNIQFINGKANINLNLNPGPYIATITTNETEYKKEASKNISYLYASTTTKSNEFIVLKKPNIELDVQNITYGENQTIKAIIDTTGNVTIKLDNKVLASNINIKNNQIEYTITGLTVGNYTIEVIYNKNKYTNQSSSIAKFTVYKANTTFKIELEPKITSEETQTINITLDKPSATGNITINLDGKDYTRPINNGFANFTTPLLNGGTYKITFTYSGDKAFNGSQVTRILNVEQITSFDLGDTNSTNEGTIELTITEENNYTGIVNVTIDNETYEVNMVNGTGNLTIPSTLTPGKYTVKIVTKNGNDTNNTGSKSFTITPKPTKTPTKPEEQETKEEETKPDQTTTPKIETKTTQENSTKKTTKQNKQTNTIKIVASTQTYKAKTKTKKYKVKLKTKKGKPIKNTKVTIKIHGRTYKAKTNKKGQATFKITKLNKKGTYTAIIKYKGNKKFKTTTKKVKIRIK